jgi:hypothetical protein
MCTKKILLRLVLFPVITVSEGNNPISPRILELIYNINIKKIPFGPMAARLMNLLHFLKVLFRQVFCSCWSCKID